MTYEELINSKDFYPHHFELYKEYGEPIRCPYNLEKFEERFGEGYKVYELWPCNEISKDFIIYRVTYYCRFKNNLGGQKCNI